MKEIRDLDELKKIELDIMKKVHLFCSKNNITYFLCYGTLLGAIRHNGFIPWDDDIDIFMPIEDYDRFCKEFPKFQDNLDLQLVNSSTKIYYGRTMSKVINNNTVLIENDFKHDDPIGVFIDIWPLSGLPNSNAKRNIYIVLHDFLFKLYCATIYKLKFDSLKHALAIVFGNIIPRKLLLCILERLDNKFSYKASKYVTSSSEMHLIVYNKSSFENQILCKFEDTEFFIPSGYDEILRNTYGDYMELPPLEERIPHHNFAAYWKE